MGKWVELFPSVTSVGSRVLKLDASLPLGRQKQLAFDFMVGEGNDVGFRLLRGNSLASAKPVFVYVVPKKRERN